MGRVIPHPPISARILQLHAKEARNFLRMHEGLIPVCANYDRHTN